MLACVNSPLFTSWLRQDEDGTSAQHVLLLRFPVQNLSADSSSTSLSTAGTSCSTDQHLTVQKHLLQAKEARLSQPRLQHADSLNAIRLWIFSIIPVLVGLNVLVTQPKFLLVWVTECGTSSMCCVARVISPRRHASWFPAGPSTHSVVLADELEDRDLVVLRELVLWRVLGHSFIRDTPEKECQRCKM